MPSSRAQYFDSTTLVLACKFAAAWLWFSALLDVVAAFVDPVDRSGWAFEEWRRAIGPVVEASLPGFAMWLVGAALRRMPDDALASEEGLRLRQALFLLGFAAFVMSRRLPFD